MVIAKKGKVLPDGEFNAYCAKCDHTCWSEELEPTSPLELPAWKDVTQNVFVYIIEGDPQPLARPRLGNKCLYDAQRQTKMMLGIELSKQHGLRELFIGPLALDFMFYMRMPPSSRRHHDKLRGTPHFYKPDISNLIKMYEDVANKILFQDDCLIAAITARKVYDERPRTEFTIRCL